MAVPTYDQLMLPLLQFAADGEVHNIREAFAYLAEVFQLSEADLSEMLPSGKQTKFFNRVHWAKTYLVQAQCLVSAGRGHFQITQRGVDVLHQRPQSITIPFLRQFPEFVDFQTRRSSTDSTAETGVRDGEIEETSSVTPIERIDRLMGEMRAALQDEILNIVLSLSPDFFEQLVVDLLLAMGYGGAQGTGQRIGRSGDGGVDGLIQEDKLGLDAIYIQAKRWSPDRSVGRPDVQAFVGSLVGNGAVKGVFITTSYFTNEALRYAEKLPNAKVVLIDGDQLTSLMINYNVGVTVERTYTLKRIDENYFSEY